MSTMEKLLSYLPFRLHLHMRRITLIGQEREGGYTFITSPDLPGFSFMLEPGETENFRSFINAIEPSLMVYLDAHFEAEAKANHPKRMEHARLTGIRRKDQTNYVAELCPA